MNEKLMIGWSEADISPDSLGKKIPLYGQYYARIADRILMFADGKLIESGSHDELIAKRGAYYELYTTQAHDLGVTE